MIVLGSDGMEGFEGAMAAYNFEAGDIDFGGGGGGDGGGRGRAGVAIRHKIKISSPVI